MVARYVFGLGSIWLTETVIYGNATLFMLAAAWTLRAGGHVRVDMFYADASPRAKAMIDLAGALLLLLPFALVLVWLGVPYAARSWAILERSQETSGLPLVFVLKTLIPLFAVLMALQGIAQAIRAACRSEAALMPLAEILAILMVVAVIAALMAGYPVALTLAGVSLVFAVLGHLLGVMGFGILGALPQRIFGVMTNDVLLALPMFIFMGVMLEQSRIAENLLERMGRLFGSLRGGLGYSVVIVGALLAASTGIVGATAVTMGLIMLPAMMRHGYDPRLAAGTVAASATLAQIIPPSTVLVVLGDQLNNSYQAAQLAQGKFAPNVDLGERPVRRRDSARPAAGRALSRLSDRDGRAAADKLSGRRAAAAPATTGLLEALLAPILLIAAVLGSILYGVATPTEAASRRRGRRHAARRAQSAACANC